MKTLSKDQQRKLVMLWDRAGTELEKRRREALRNMSYNWQDVDALLELGHHAHIPPRTTSGLVEMQKLFAKARTATKK